MQIAVEAWSSNVARLTPEQAQEIASSGLGYGRDRTNHPTAWKLVTGLEGRDPGSHPGLGASGSCRDSRFPKLMFLLGYAADPRGWRDSVATFGRERDFFSAVASGFAHHAHRALQPAPLRGYVSVDERSPGAPGTAAGRRSDGQDPAASTRDHVRRLHHRHPREPDAAGRGELLCESAASRDRRALGSCASGPRSRRSSKRLGPRCARDHRLNERYAPALRLAELSCPRARSPPSAARSRPCLRLRHEHGVRGFPLGRANRSVARRTAAPSGCSTTAAISTGSERCD